MGWVGEINKLTREFLFCEYCYSSLSPIIAVKTVCYIVRSIHNLQPVAALLIIG